MFYHGTAIEMEEGDELLPPEKTGVISESGRKKNRDKVFFTKDKGSAKIYAGRAKKSLDKDQGFIYEVDPVGEVVCLNDNPGTTVFMCDKLVVTNKEEV